MKAMKSHPKKLYTHTQHIYREIIALKPLSSSHSGDYSHRHFMETQKPLINGRGSSDVTQTPGGALGLREKHPSHPYKLKRSKRAKGQDRLLKQFTTVV